MSACQSHTDKNDCHNCPEQKAKSHFCGTSYTVHMHRFIKGSYTVSSSKVGKLHFNNHTLVVLPDIYRERNHDDKIQCDALWIQTDIQTHTHINAQEIK